MVGPPTIVVGRTPLLQADILRSMVPLVVSRLSAVAIVVPTIVIFPIVILVTTEIVVMAVVVAATIVVPSAEIVTSAVVLSPPVVVIVTVVVIAPVVFVAVVVVIPIAVVISVYITGMGSLEISGSLSRGSSWRLRHLWLHLSDRSGIAVEQIIFAEFECMCPRVANGAMHSKRAF